VKELKAFCKVSLEPSEAKTVRMQLDQRAFAFYDPTTRQWVVEPGAYDLLIGGSAADIELQVTVRLEAAE
jgi:beta-glucosidase